jgi:hypothetical protein
MRVGIASQTRKLHTWAPGKYRAQPICPDKTVYDLLLPKTPRSRPPLKMNYASMILLRIA